MSPRSLADRVPVLSLALRNLSRSKTRSALAAIGIAIGVIAIVSLGMFGSAFQRSQMENIGTIGNNVGVFPGEDLDRANFTETQLQEIRRSAQPADLIAIKQDSREMRTREGTTSRTVYGIAEPDRLFDVRDGQIPPNWRSGIVVGDQLATVEGIETGDAMNLDGQTYRVAAVLEDAGQATLINPNSAVILPPSRFAEDTYTQVIVLSDTTAEATQTAERIRTAMNDRRERVQVFEFSQLAQQIGQLFLQLNLFLIGIGAVSLVVAGTSILNVMLMSTVERRGEIGVLRAVGFKRLAVLRIFLTEAALLGLIGGTAGVIVSVLIGAGIHSLFLGDPLAFDTLSLIYIGGGFSFGIGSGLISGAYPAWKASQLDPVEALRE
ncbi:ABC transporter permease [Halorhabdus rudnickae]|uniref:ABC transporter permease n=1 Tax=Halorhabdus rudnickae TaxID=1775544 RepID=UPI001082AB6F|nr:ABC transporter permease [Halorhabdus rudnickae]